MWGIWLKLVKKLGWIYDDDSQKIFGLRFYYSFNLYNKQLTYDISAEMGSIAIFELRKNLICYTFFGVFSIPNCSKNYSNMCNMKNEVLFFLFLYKFYTQFFIQYFWVNEIMRNDKLGMTLHLWLKKMCWQKFQFVFWIFVSLVCVCTNSAIINFFFIKFASILINTMC